MAIGLQSRGKGLLLSIHFFGFILAIFLFNLRLADADLPQIKPEGQNSASPQMTQEPFIFYYIYPVGGYSSSIENGIFLATQSWSGLKSGLDAFDCIVQNFDSSYVGQDGNQNGGAAWAYSEIMVQSCGKVMSKKIIPLPGERWENFIKRCSDNNFHIVFEHEGRTKLSCGAL